MKTIWKLWMWVWAPDLLMSEMRRREQTSCFVEEFSALEDHEIVSEWRRLRDAKEFWGPRWTAICAVAAARYSGVMRREKQRAELRELIAKN